MLNVYHGTPKLSHILEKGSIDCLSLQSAPEVYRIHLEKYTGLVERFAQLARAREAGLEEGVSDVNFRIGRSNGTDCVLADIVSQAPHLFGVSGDDAQEYKELRRGVHVFFAHYKRASNHASGYDQAVLECAIDDSMADNQLVDGWTLVPGSIGFEKVSRIYVPWDRVDGVKKRVSGGQGIVCVEQMEQ
jgi:hypothetical protein